MTLFQLKRLHRVETVGMVANGK